MNKYLSVIGISILIILALVFYQKGILPQDTKRDILSAFAREKDGFSYMILAENGQEIVLEKSKSDVSTGGATFGKPELSPDNNYLTYLRSEWERGDLMMYSVEDAKIVDLGLSGYPDTYGFTPDNKHFYVCIDEEIGVGTKYGRVYDVPDFDIKYDLATGARLQGYFTVECQYNKNQNSIKFTFNEDPRESFEQERTIEYFFDTEKFQEVSKE